MRGVSPQVVGRERELVVLRDSLRASLEGEPSVVLLTGEAGIGKSRLVARAEWLAGEQGSRVLRGECVDLAGAELPYAPVAAALRAAGASELAAAAERLPSRARQELAPILPGLGPEAGTSAGQGPDEAAQARLFTSLLELIGLIAARSPVLLVLEDLHWADRSTLDFLGHLVRNVRSARLAVLSTVRTEALQPRLRTGEGHHLRRLVAELGRLPRVERLELEPLGRPDVARQIELILGAAPAKDVVEAVWARSSGVPYHVEELLAAGGHPGGGPPPSGVHEAVLLRVEELSHTTQDVLRVLAGFSRPVTQDLAGEVAGLPDDPLCVALREGLAAHLLRREPGDAFGFRHALAREAVYAELLPGERTALHAAIAAALARRPETTSAAELALHALEAGDLEGSLAASLEAGAAAEAVHAPAEALVHYERALSLWDRVPAGAGRGAQDLVEVIGRAAEAAFLTAEHETCTRLWERALAQVDPARDPARAAWLYERLGRCQPWKTEASLAAYHRALALLPATPSATRARLLADVAFALTFAEDWERARLHAEQALEMALAVGARPEEVSARSTLGVALGFLGRCDAGEAELRRALELARPDGQASELTRIHLDLAEILRLEGRFADALDVMRDGEAIAREGGMEESIGRFMTANAAEDELRLGRWEEADASLEHLAGDDLGPTVMIVRESVAGRLAAARGDGERASVHLARAAELSGEVEAIEFAPAILAGQAELALWQGRPAEARRHVVAGLEAIGEAADPLHAPVLFSIGVRAAADEAESERLRSRRAPGIPEWAERLLAQLDRIVEAHRREAPEAMAHRQLAAAELARLRGGSSPELWQRAAEAWDELSAPAPAAYARWRQAEAHVSRPGGRDAAARALARAREAALRLGARPLLEEIEDLARRARLDLAAAAAPEPPHAGAEARDVIGLTPRELEVLRLLAIGLTDRQIGERLFISSRTAQVHVSRIRAKLDAGNRTAAAGAAQRLGLVERPAEAAA